MNNVKSKETKCGMCGTKDYQECVSYAGFEFCRACVEKNEV